MRRVTCSAPILRSAVAGPSCCNSNGGARSRNVTTRPSPRPGSAPCAAVPSSPHPTSIRRGGSSRTTSTTIRPRHRSARTIDPQHCYICKVRYREIHHFYDQLCPDCAALNFAKRGELADMSGMVVLLTGGRVKIGYQAGIKLLRCGAELIVATRFPRDAASAMPPNRTSPSGATDSRCSVSTCATPRVSRRSAPTSWRRALDSTAIVNNACQTVRRPPAFYEHMMDNETAALVALPPEVLRLVGSYESLRGGETAIEAAASAATSTRPQHRSRWPCLCPRRHRASRADPCRGDVASGVAARRPADDRHPVSRRAARPGPPAGRSPRPEFVATADARSVVGRTARDPARQRGRSVRAQRPPQVRYWKQRRATTSTS